MTLVNTQQARLSVNNATAIPNPSPFSKKIIMIKVDHKVFN